MATIGGTINNPAGRRISHKGISRITGIIIQSSALFGLSLISIDPDLSFSDFINTDFDAARMDRLVRERRKSTVNTLGHGIEFKTLAEKYGAEYESATEAALPAIANLTVDTADGDAVANWDDFASATSYLYKLFVYGEQQMMAHGTTVSSSLVLADLDPGTYTLRIKAKGAADVSLSKWTDFSFTIPAAEPANLTVGTITATGATGNWDDYPTATGYDYEIRTAVGDTLVTSGTVVPSTKAVTGLTTATNYVFKVRATFAAGDPTAWASAAFTTA